MEIVLSDYEIGALCFLLFILGWSFHWLYDGNLKLYLEIRKKKKIKIIKCPECDFETDNWVTFREHVEEKHIDAYYQYMAWVDRHGLY